MLKQRLRRVVHNWIRRLISPVVMDIILHDTRIFVDRSRLSIANTAVMSNALLNTNSGTITIGEYTFCGQNVSIITGTHDYHVSGIARQRSIPQTGQDIVIGSGVWIGTNAVILGPCRIGDNAVIAAGAIVTKDIEANVIVAGVPATVIKRIQLD